MKLIGCMSIFNDNDPHGRLLTAAVRSLAQACDHLAVVDGAYDIFPARGVSHDGPRLVCAVEAFSYNRVLTYLEATPLSEATKRSLCFRGEPGDRYVVLDGDEQLVETYAGAIRARVMGAEDLGTDVLSIPVYRPWDRVVVMQPRIFAHKVGIRYGRTHADIVADHRAGEPYISLRAPAEQWGTAEEFGDALILHKHHLRSDERKAQKGAWHEALKAERGAS